MIAKLTKPKKSVVRVGDSSRNKAESVGKHEINGDEVGGGKVDNKVDKEVVKNRKMSKFKKSSKSKKTVRSSDFFTFRAKLAFIKLRQTFLKTLILHQFDPECHIQIETDASGYIIGGVLCQLTLDGLGL